METLEVANRVLPHDTGAEQAFLGALIIDPPALDTAITLLAESDFFDVRHRTIFRAIRRLWEARSAIDTITIANFFKDHGLVKDAGGVEYLNEILDATPTAANVTYYAKIVRDKALLRSLIKAAGEIANTAMRADQDVSSISNYAENLLFEITNRNLTQSYEGIQNIVHASIKIIQDFRNRNGKIGLTTGFSDFDRLTGGLTGGQLIIIAGRPGSGKTAFCLNMASRIAIESKRPILIFSLEMQKEELGVRLLTSEAKVDNSRIKQSLLSQADMNQLIYAADRLYETQIVIDDKPNITVNEIRAKSRRVMSERGDLALIIIDYMQLVDGPEDIPRYDRYNIISDVSRSLKYLAKELNVPVIALSQLSRKIEDRSDRRPMLSDLRESGAIEQDADIVAFIHRNYIYTKDESEKNIAELLIRKHRNGPQGEIPLHFRGECMRFDDGVRRAEE
ncbi:MAG TPA: replicative DNA helicase [Spirochaetota bacterium]|nr:replicative DNA helicase [Spirochaetota bacterium]HPH02042.1 replicative DNA helicase [Spirochaetota bacterium]HPN83260.1 replicative DNA helicase [Spirochaetota bacterium]